jgi:hypothetical protein
MRKMMGILLSIAAPRRRRDIKWYCMGRDISFPPSISNGLQHHMTSIENGMPPFNAEPYGVGCLQVLIPTKKTKKVAE